VFLTRKNWIALLYQAKAAESSRKSPEIFIQKSFDLSRSSGVYPGYGGGPVGNLAKRQEFTGNHGDVFQYSSNNSHVRGVQTDQKIEFARKKSLEHNLKSGR